MSTVTTPLKYLFEALYKDGFVFKQPVDDKSPLHPEEQLEGGGVFQPSAFRAVEAYQEEHGELLEFWLKAVDADNYAEYGLSLDNGLISVNGHVVQPYLGERFDGSLTKLKLIFFREVRQEMVITGNEHSVGDPYVTRYILGWQEVGTDNKHVIAVT